VWRIWLSCCHRITTIHAVCLATSGVASPKRTAAWLPTDCLHPQMGLNGVDNGQIWFDNVRVSRDAMLDR
jgi:alkylation response protein AidB-like acyl-CoA dehydrogenase